MVSYYCFNLIKEKVKFFLALIEARADGKCVVPNKNLELKKLGRQNMF